MALSSHVDVSGDRPWHDVLLDLSAGLKDRFGIAHVTLQPEEGHRLPDAYRGCSIETADGRAVCVTSGRGH